MQTLASLQAAAEAEWNRISALPVLSPKDKMSITPQFAAELSPFERRTSMEETNLGFTDAQAKVEASRCLKCKKPFCTAACPIGMPVPQYLEHLATGDMQGAIDIIRNTSLLPSICSRVCPHEKQCESNCALGKSLKDKTKGLKLGLMERYCADYERKHLGGKKPLQVAPSTGKRIAVIGSGPAGISAAIDLRTKGHEVIIFESYDLLGGVLRYGIPEFRLPKKILDYEFSVLSLMGIECKTGITIGKDISIESLSATYDAVFIGCGAGLALKTGALGENLQGIFTAEEYLRKANRKEPIDSGENVVIVGGGNVAMDASRMAYRLGAKKVRIVYRRTQNEMPACKAELSEALDEGVEVLELKNPSAYIGDIKGRVSKIKLDLFELGAIDEQGRPRPVKLEGQTETIDCDTVVLAIGSKVSSEINSSALEVNRNGTYVVKDPLTGKTTMQNVYVGGDAMLGPKTVVLAMKTGRDAAAAIHKALGYV